MPPRLYTVLLSAFGLGFAALFAFTVVPPLLRDGDVWGAFAAGFVNPYASGYAMDAIACWCILTTWVVHEARSKGVRHGWVAVVLGIAPGVATGLAFYLLLRQRQVARPAA
jgi:hypothetical protein